MRSKISDAVFLAQTHEDGSDFRTSDLCIGAEVSCVIAGKQTSFLHSAYAFFRISADGSGILEIRCAIFQSNTREFQVSCQYNCCLFSCDRCVGRKGGIADAGYQIVCICPANGIAIPCITGNIGKGAAACMRSTVEAVKYRNQHASCHGLTGRELCFADTGEQTSLCDIGNSRCIPLICRYITEVCRTCGRLLHSCKNNFYHVSGFQMQQLLYGALRNAVHQYVTYFITVMRLDGYAAVIVRDDHTVSLVTFDDRASGCCAVAAGTGTAGAASAGAITTGAAATIAAAAIAAATVAAAAIAAAAVAAVIAIIAASTVITVVTASTVIAAVIAAIIF